MKRKCFFAVCMICFVAFLSCDETGPGKYPHQNSQEGKQNSYSIQSTIIQANAPMWEIQSIANTDHEEVFYVQFINPTLGWMASREGSLYKTIDGGQTWENEKIATLKESLFVSSLYFINSSLGWASLQTYASDEDDISHKPEAKILHTNDGGKNWRLQYSKTPLFIERIQFITETEGWAVGSSIYHTIDQGKNWIDVSNGLKNIIEHRQARLRIVDVSLAKPSGAMVVTNRGEILTTNNGGVAWQREASVPVPIFAHNDKARRLQHEGKSIWVITGGERREEAESFLTRIDETGLRTTYTLASVLCEDILLLSDNQIIACGFMKPVKQAPGFYGKKQGVILYSNNGGREWAVVYQNEKVGSINALTMSAPNKVFAVGENGLVLKIQM